MKTAKNIWKNRYVLYELVRKRVKTQYRNSVLGMLWTILNPLLNMLVMWLVFSQFFGENDPYYPLYLLSGTIMFSALSSATNGALTSIVDNRELITRVKIDNYLFPLSTTLSSLINFAFSMISLLLIMLGMQIFGGHSLFSYRMIFVLLMVPAFIMFEYGIGLFLSAIYIFCRDIKYLYTVFLTLWTYITPIFYKVDTAMIASNSLATTVIKCNPMYYFVRYFRDAMYYYETINWGVPYFKTLGLLYIFGIVSIIIGTLVYKPLKKHFIRSI